MFFEYYGNPQPKYKCAIFCYLFYEDLFEESMQYIANIPIYCDVYIATDNDRKTDNINALSGKYLRDHHVEILLHTERGRDVSALLVLFRNYVIKYEIICFLHDKKSLQMKYESVGKDFNNHLWNSLLHSGEQIENILRTFAKEPYLGLLVPPMVTHGEYFHTAIDFWTLCYDGTIELARKLGLDVEISRRNNPLSVGTAFWGRTRALKKLFDFEFAYEMFPAEPFPIDGSISHCVERILPYVALDAGYYTGVVYSRDIAQNSLLGQSYALNQILRRLGKIDGINTTTLKNTLCSLDNNILSNSPVDSEFIDGRWKTREPELIACFDKKYDLFEIYKWIRNWLLVSGIYSEKNFQRNFGFRVGKRIFTELAVYRYGEAGVILDAIEDYLKGPDILDHFFRVYHYDDVHLITDIDMKWYRICQNIDDCDFWHYIIRLFTLNGYFLKADRHIIIPPDGYRAVQGYRASEIVFWDNSTCCGYTRKKNFKKALAIYIRFKKLMHSLKHEYKRIVAKYRRDYSYLKTEQMWMEKLESIDSAMTR